MPSLSNGFFPSDLSTKILCTFNISPMRATWSAQLIHPDLITLIIFG
jgi:hypothetical protein